MAESGTLLVITRFRDTDTEPDGPPWSLSEKELAQFEQSGLREIHRDVFLEISDNVTIQQLRLEYRRQDSIALSN